jgi:hypothetical protein
MDTSLRTQPTFVNDEPFSSELFPKVVGFCDRDNSSHVKNNDEESFLYTLGKETIYTIKHKQHRWEVIELANGIIHRINAAQTLREVLIHSLSFSEKDKNNQDKRVNILFPIEPSDMEKTLAIMYYLGGYPNSGVLGPTENALILEKFHDPRLEYLTYSYVPINYIQWLRDSLKQADLIGQTPNRTIWVYKK